MLKIIHGADFHLDSPFSGLTPERAAQRRREQRELLERLAILAQTEQADLVLLAGDLLDSEKVFQETGQALAQAMGDIPCPVFIAPGNHDCYSPRSLYATLAWPENVHIFSTSQLQAVELPELNCTVWGRAFTGSHQDTSPLSGLSVPHDGRLHLACLHGCVNAPGAYGPISLAEISASGLDYLALGHIHQYSGLQREGNTFWAYPGCPEGRGFDETGEKGVLLLQVEPSQIQCRFLPLGRRRYEIITADITGMDPAQAVRAALPPDASEHIFRILLTGEGDRPDLSALEQALSGLCYGLSLRDQSRMPRDLWARRDEDTLTGLFLRAMWEQCQSRPDDPVCQLAVRYGLDALENREGGSL